VPLPNTSPCAISGRRERCAVLSRSQNALRADSSSRGSDGPSPWVREDACVLDTAILARY
jgi:hypothetical protein